VQVPYLDGHIAVFEVPYDKAPEIVAAVHAGKTVVSVMPMLSQIDFAVVSPK
jgi:predicted dinucleotide-binding enzyme